MIIIIWKKQDDNNRATPAEPVREKSALHRTGADDVIACDQDEWQARR